MNFSNSGKLAIGTMLFSLLSLSSTFAADEQKDGPEILAALCNPAAGMSVAPEVDSKVAIALQHFQENGPTITGYLEGVSPELHFFWTTGRTLSDNLAYGPVTDVQVGGSQYGRKFFPYVEALIQSSPDNLKIVFVCDLMTYRSNHQQIGLLENQHGSRFEILLIDNVVANLLKIFDAPAQQQKITALFKNATQGNPVIASDVYRIIGMIYGQDVPNAPVGTMRTYCDIDAFCYGMEHNKHGELIEALFKSVFTPTTTAGFYFGRAQANNDIIKICITDIDNYKKLCDRQLQKIKINSVVIPKYNKNPVVLHFEYIHRLIKWCEGNPNNCSNIIANIPDPIYNLIQEVIQTTGPTFLSDDSITSDLSYPSICAGAWGAPEDALDYRRQGYGRELTNPEYILDWGHYDLPQAQLDAFTKDCDTYKKYLSVYIYAKRFGQNHPFNIEIKKHLMDEYPYHQDSFKELLKANFDCSKQQNELTYLEWRAAAFERITVWQQWDQFHYLALRKLLFHHTEIRFPLITLESIDAVVDPDHSLSLVAASPDISALELE
ncbi:MAG: hypothetical protein WCG04_00730 [Alphaproteobacteria bacterium]